MPKALTDNVAGHQAKYELLAANLPPEEVGKHFVGNTDPVTTGYLELDFLRSVVSISGASIVDIGCGIGRLTRHLVSEDIKNYLGTDVVPQILDEARACAAGDPRFSFAIAEDCKIPADNGSATLVAAFSVITHLLDEEAFEYIREAHRVLKPGGAAVFTFYDFMNDSHLEIFFRHASQHRHGHGDILKFTTAAVLEKIARYAGFAGIEFIGPETDLHYSGTPSPLFNVEPAGTPYRMGGQAICVMRK
jgi:2-polyprenyl-3-methyl-5-hydroxy-6-metoxy-1,4-benzoquinol methylase